MERDASFSGLMQGFFRLLGDTWKIGLIYIAVVGGLNAIGIMLGLIAETDTLAGWSWETEVDPSMGAGAAIFQIVVLVVQVIAAYYLAAAILQARGRLGEGGTRIWAYVGLAILSVLGIILGFALIVVPGIILLVRWSASTGYLLGDRTGIIEALGKSWEATRGHSWSIFGAALVLFLVFVIAAAIVGGAIGGVLGAAGWTDGIAVVSAFAESAGGVFSAVLGITIYLAVSDRSDDMREVFS